jgi:hypothetical protein
MVPLPEQLTVSDQEPRLPSVEETVPPSLHVPSTALSALLSNVHPSDFTLSPVK